MPDSSSSSEEPPPVKVVLFYRYVALSEDEQQLLSDRTESKCTELDILGRLLVAHEGINGTFSGSVESIDALVFFLSLSDTTTTSITTSTNNNADYSWAAFVNKFRLAFSKIDFKFSITPASSGALFTNLCVRRVTELVGGSHLAKCSHTSYSEDTFGGLEGTGRHLTPQEFHTAITNANKNNDNDNDSRSGNHKAAPIVLDIRNGFEVSTEKN
jgi:predicted sulfurtransferase